MSTPSFPLEHVVVKTKLAFGGLYTGVPDINGFSAYQNGSFVLFNNGTQWVIASDRKGTQIYAAHPLASYKSVEKIGLKEEWLVAVNGGFVADATLSVERFQVIAEAPEFIRVVNSRLPQLNVGFRLLPSESTIDRPTYGSDSGLFLRHVNGYWCFQDSEASTAATLAQAPHSARHPLLIDTLFDSYDVQSDAYLPDLDMALQLVSSECSPYTPSTPAWEDEAFPAEDSMLGAIVDGLPLKAGAVAFSPVTWVRAVDMRPVSGKRKTVHPSDCAVDPSPAATLVTVAGALAAYPEAIDRLFPDGACRSPVDGSPWRVRLLNPATAKWETVEVSDLLPCETPSWWQAGDRWVMAAGADTLSAAVWPLILQKAAAKVLGGWEHLSSLTDPLAALYMLTGCKTLAKHQLDLETAKLSSGRDLAFSKLSFTAPLAPLEEAEDAAPLPMEVLVHILAAQLENGNIVAASIPLAEEKLDIGAVKRSQQPDGSLKRDDGLTEGLVYALLEVAHIEDGSATTLLRLRSPSNDSLEWQGAWSLGSPLWTEATEPLKTKATEGSFWISLADFAARFQSIFVAETRLKDLKKAASLLRTGDLTPAGPLLTGANTTLGRLAAHARVAKLKTRINNRRELDLAVRMAGDHKPIVPPFLLALRSAHLDAQAGRLAPLEGVVESDNEDAEDDQEKSQQPPAGTFVIQTVDLLGSDGVRLAPTVSAAGAEYPARRTTHTFSDPSVPSPEEAGVVPEQLKEELVETVETARTPKRTAVPLEEENEEQEEVQQDGALPSADDAEKEKEEEQVDEPESPAPEEALAPSGTSTSPGEEIDSERAGKKREQGFFAAFFACF